MRAAQQAERRRWRPGSAQRPPGSGCDRRSCPSASRSRRKKRRGRGRAPAPGWSPRPRQGAMASPARSRVAVSASAAGEQRAGASATSAPAAPHAASASGSVEPEPIAAEHRAQRRAAAAAADVGRGERVGEHRLQRSAADAEHRAITRGQQGPRQAELDQNQVGQARIGPPAASRNGSKRQQEVQRQAAATSRRTRCSSSLTCKLLRRSISPSISGPAQVQAPAVDRDASTFWDLRTIGWSSQRLAERTLGRADRLERNSTAGGRVASNSRLARPPGNARCPSPASRIHSALRPTGRRRCCRRPRDKWRPAVAGADLSETGQPLLSTVSAAWRRPAPRATRAHVALARPRCVCGKGRIKCPQIPSCRRSAPSIVRRRPS